MKFNIIMMMINNTDGLYGFYHMPPILCYDVFIWTVIHACPAKKRENKRNILYYSAWPAAVHEYSDHHSWPLDLREQCSGTVRLIEKLCWFFLQKVKNCTIQCNWDTLKMLFLLCKYELQEAEILTRLQGDVVYKIPTTT